MGGDVQKIAALIERAIDRAVKAERKRCYGLALDAARERQDTGDREGAGAIFDLAADIKGARTNG